MILVPSDNKLPMEASYNDILSVLTSPSCSLNGSRVSLSNAHTPPSFEDPFDDPNMEPLPLKLLKRPLLAPHNIPLIPSRSGSSAFITREDCLSSCSFMEQELYQQESQSDATNLRINLVDILDPVIDLIGSKRSPDAMLSDYDHSDSHTIKRQRICPAVDPVCESAARFRPYQEKQWQLQFQKLIQYKHEYGTCCVPHSYREDPALARWVKRQRYQYKKFNDGDTTSTMTTHRIQDLESIGFVWQSHASAWQEKLNELKAFQQQSGHCNVPSTYQENVSLSTWVKCQRRQYKLFATGGASSMTLDRFQVLESMGFVFDLQQQRLGESHLKIFR